MVASSDDGMDTQLQEEQSPHAQAYSASRPSSQPPGPSRQNEASGGSPFQALLHEQ